MPVSELEAMLPALKITLPSGSSLQGGTANIKLDLEGPTNQLTAAGALSLNKTRLTGFSLSTKMRVIQTLAGIQGLPDTDIETLSTNVRASQAGGAALDDIKLVAPSVGELNGAGTISASNALDFKMSAKVHTAGLMAAVSNAPIPFTVQGTASDPVFRPDVKGIVKQQINDVKSDAVKTGFGLLENLLEKKKK
jgi:AsmA protein